jgi:hypothetical protein
MHHIRERNKKERDACNVRAHRSVDVTKADDHSQGHVTLVTALPLFDAQAMVFGVLG